ncbi:hypothetical protein M433DRAFT_157000 [Acidomyces richmondensis BFW]|nr:MAG: hypothetical protein FE78DRAFT_501505 [Acidomyces sp. 'richmondensis']KYG43243.1 hypothetical protein M433DRAFT_157000 [Acidomyces richmondensis BFW]
MYRSLTLILLGIVYFNIVLHQVSIVILADHQLVASADSTSEIGRFISIPTYPSCQILVQCRYI